MCSSDLVFIVTEEDRTARQIAEKREAAKRAAALSRSRKRISLEDITKHMADGKVETLNLILRGDAAGSVEALEEALLGIEIDRGRHAADLRAALGGLKGPLMKVAQLLSTIPDALPDEYVQELIQLQSNAPAMGWPFVRRRMASELGPDWEGKFKSFEHQAAAAASLGQVHRAIGHDGAQLA